MTSMWATLAVNRIVLFGVAGSLSLGVFQIPTACAETLKASSQTQVTETNESRAAETSSARKIIEADRWMLDIPTDTDTLSVIRRVRIATPPRDSCDSTDVSIRIVNRAGRVLWQDSRFQHHISDDPMYWAIEAVSLSARHRRWDGGHGLELFSRRETSGVRRIYSCMYFLIHENGIDPKTDWDCPCGALSPSDPAIYNQRNGWYNVSIPYTIDFEGDRGCYPNPQRDPESGLYAVEVWIGYDLRIESESIVPLFVSPRGEEHAEVRVTPSSSVDFVQAFLDDDLNLIRLFVRVDDQSGYVEFEHLGALGVIELMD